MANDKKKELKELTEGMQRLCAVANRIVALKGAASRLDTDLLLDDLRRLYDVALRLSGDPVPNPKVEVEEESSPTLIEKPDDHMMAMMSTMAAMAPQEKTEAVDNVEKTVVSSPDPAPNPEPVATFEEPSKNPPDQPTPTPIPSMEDLEPNDNGLLFDEIIIEPEPEKEAEQKQEEKQPEPEPSTLEDTTQQEVEAPSQESKTVQVSLLDYLQNSSQRTLGDTLAAQHPMQNTLERKVDDLRTVININDRFSFMSELFHNNIKAYNDFIMSLNATDSRKEAMKMVDEMALQQKWNPESPTVAAFHKILDKKF